MQVSTRVRKVQPAVIQEIFHEIARSKGTISLGQGVPFFGPPEDALVHFEDAYKKASAHTYGQDAGYDALRIAIAEKLKNENSLTVSPENELMITAGANHAFFNSILALCDKGDEVILLSPYYFNHEMAIRLINCKPVIVPTTENYQLDLERIEERITKRTKAIVTISPNNPTGAVYTRSSLDELNKLCADLEIMHISDETYEYFIYDGKQHYSPGKEHRESTINIFSFSKSYGMSGWRVGYMTFPEQLFEQLLKIQDTILICPSLPSQLLALECLKVGSKYTKKFLPQIEESRNIIYSYLKELEPILRTPRTSGAFYFYCKLDTHLPSKRIAYQLIRDYKVAVVPGETFGESAETTFRISYGNVRPEIARKGMERFSKGIREIVV